MNPLLSEKKQANPHMSDKGVELLNFRIEQEELSSRLYLSMSMWLNDNGYLGAAKKWKQYADEEMTHADWAREYLLSMGVQPTTPSLPIRKQTYTGLPEIIKMSFDHEVKVTQQCKDLASACLKGGDYMLFELALKYLREQVEEHGKFQDLMDRLVAFGSTPTALRFLDNELGS